MTNRLFRFTKTLRWPAASLGACGLLILLSACSKSQNLFDQDPLYEEQIFALGAIVNISIYGVDHKAAAQASQQLTADFDHLHRTWHAWNPSPLTRLNADLKTGKPVKLEIEMIPLLTRARELSLASGNLFNPTIGKLLALWGWHSDDRPDGPPPAATAIAALVAAQPGMGDLHLEQDQLYSANPAVELDVGAIGKGYAADTAIAHLRRLGIDNAIVAASGDIHVIGRHGKRPWRIGIRNPRGPGVIASLEMQGDESISTSGDYERYFDYQGKRYCHIIDPRSGYPVRDTISVTVLHRDATTADAAATAMMIAGPKDWPRVARAMGVTQVMLIDAKGVVHMSPALAKRLRFELETAPTVEISPAL